MKDRDKWVDWVSELQSIAQSGLAYTQNIYDIERFERLREIACEMASEMSGYPKEKVKTLFCGEDGYQTPKVDARAVVFKDGKILLARENSGKWSLPGGWCDVNLSAAENARKEAKEEAGKDVIPKSIIAVQDRSWHNEPVFFISIYKIFIMCEEVGGEFVPNSETTEIGYFALDGLPEISEDKNNFEQIKMCFDAYAMGDKWKTVFD